MNTGDWRDIVIIGPEQHGPKPQKVAGNLEADNLSGAAEQNLVRTGPSRSDDKGRMVDLALTDKVTA